VDTASICASIPVFWPAMMARFSGISVTREITITREDRRFLDLGDGAGLELRPSKVSSDGHPGSTHSRAGSETHINGNSTEGFPTHYNDTYVLDQVDPLRKDKNVGVESTVTVGPLDARLERQTSRTLYLKR
jgi:hypothetical protein